MDYKQFYEKISAPLRKASWSEAGLRLVNRLFTRAVYIIYPVFLLSLLVERDLRVIKVTLVPAVFFWLLTFLRRWIDRPRPYETWQIDPLIHKDTKGHSMPSRHVFSCTLIAMAIASIYPLAGAAMLGISIILAAIRVLGGVHYPSDVLAGFLAGLACGSLCLLF